MDDANNGHTYLMTTLASDDQPRHGRMFELLRQSAQAELTSTRLTDPDAPSAQDLIQELRQTAIDSLRPIAATPDGFVIPKPKKAKLKRRWIG